MRRAKEGVVALKKAGGYEKPDGGEVKGLTPTSEWAKHFARDESPFSGNPNRKLTIDLHSGGYPHLAMEVIWLDGARELCKKGVKLDLRGPKFDADGADLDVSIGAAHHAVKNHATAFLRYEVVFHPLGNTLQARLFVGSQGDFFPDDQSSVLASTPALT